MLKRNIYLCTKDKHYNTRYRCKKFDDFEKLEKHYHNYLNSSSIFSIIEVYRFNPFYKFELWYKLSKRINIDIE